jgi:hypothetical protein
MVLQKMDIVLTAPIADATDLLNGSLSDRLALRRRLEEPGMRWLPLSGGASGKKQMLTLLRTNTQR